MRVRAHKIRYPKHLVLGERVEPVAKKRLLILNANQVLSVSPDMGRPRIGAEMKDLGIIPNGAVVIEGDRIADVGPTEDITGRYPESECEVVDARGKIVLPGFVDAHTHLIFAGSRENELPLKIEGSTYEEIAQLGGGIEETVRKTRKADSDKLIEEGLDRLNRMLRSGSTTIEAKSGYGLTTKDELKILRVAKELDKIHPVDLVPTFMGAHAVPPEFSGRKEDYIEEVVQTMLPQIAEESLAVFSDVFCEEGYFSIDDSRVILQSSKDSGLEAKIHADELSDSGGATLAAELGAVSAEHLLLSSDASLARMAEAGVIAVLLPGTPFMSFMSNYADARKMLDFEIPLALGTDFNPNCWVESMQTVIGLACMKMRMHPEEAIVAATLNAAYAVGRGHLVGSLTPGKKADLLIMDLPNYLHIAYRFGSNHVDKVIKDGRMVF